MKYSENYIDQVMNDGRARTARQVIDEIISYIEDTPGKVSFAYVPEQRKVSHYLRTNKQYVLIETNRQTGNTWAAIKIKCIVCDGTGNMIEMPCNKCEGLGEIDNELD